MLFFLGFGIGSMKPMPANAVLLVDVTAKEYVSPPCLEKLPYENPSRFSVRTTRKDLPKEFNAERQCANGIPGWFSKEDGFWQESTVSSSFLRKWGFWPGKPRWNEDGTWNW